MKKNIITNIINIMLSTSLLFLLWACKEDSNPVNNDEILNSKTVIITPNAGGNIQLSNNQGDIIKLTIPPYTVTDDQQITLQIFNDILPNPFSQNILSTIRILPDGLKLDSAATISVTFRSAINDTAQLILYYSKQNDIAYPLETRWVNNLTIEGKIFHFSNYGAAKPNHEEVSSQANKLNNDFNYNVWDWQGFSQYVAAMLKYIEFCQFFGDDETAGSLTQQLEQKIVNQVNAFLNLPIPEEPCGYYLQTLLKYSAMVFTMVSNEQLEQRVQNRLNETLNRCYLRGELEFDYQYCISAEGAEICRTITGFVPFTVNTTVEPYGQIHGSGVLDWNGTMNGIPFDCFYIESGTVAVSLGGELSVDEFGSPQISFEISEHASGTVTAGCQGVLRTYPFNPPDVVHNIMMVAEDGTEYMMPIPGASSGSFKWTLHLTVNN